MTSQYRDMINWQTNGLNKEYLDKLGWRAENS